MPRKSEKPRLPPSKQGQRSCLGCGRYFLSDGPSNRFCKTCKRSTRKLAGGLEAISMDDRLLPRRRD